MSFKNNVFTAFLALVFLAQMSCTKKTPTDLAQGDFIPYPMSVTATQSSFTLTDKTEIFVQGGGEEGKRVAQYLADKLKPATGFAFNVQATEQAAPTGNISLVLSSDANLGAEGYELTVTEESVTITASAAAGLFYGVQTLRQTLPASVEKASVQQGPWEVPTGTIKDQPELSYRGAMLDVSRHFFGVDDVKRYLDLLSFYKMNALHLHLSDDQGWRIEIKSWPNLTAHGSTVQVGGGKGGFYTQEQYKDLVKYAQERFITIIPEIDMPGHTNAALASYAELNCNGKATELYTGTEVGFSTFCTNKEVTYKFIDDVIRELSEITPGPYLHIGGDESHATPLKDYIPFINRVQDMVKAHGKKVIGWDEIANATMVENTVVQHWDNLGNANKALQQGAKVLMSPAKKAYLDMQYDSTSKLGLHWAAYIEVDSAYMWDPMALIPGIAKESVLGIEAPLWTETIVTMEDLEYMVFPRLLGIAEIGWLPASKRNWDVYKARLGKHGERLTAMDINFYPSKLVPWAAPKP